MYTLRGYFEREMRISKQILKELVPQPFPQMSSQHPGSDLITLSRSRWISLEIRISFCL